MTPDRFANLEAWAVTQGYDMTEDYTSTDLPEGYVSEHFRQTEFACNHCGQIHPTNPTPPKEVLEWLEVIRDQFNDKPVVVNSGYRCPTHNANVGGAKGSYHLKGQAVDFSIPGVAVASIYHFADQLVGNDGGVGRYPTFVHIDNRGYKARW